MYFSCHSILLGVGTLLRVAVFPVQVTAATKVSGRAVRSVCSRSINRKQCWSSVFGFVACPCLGRYRFPAEDARRRLGSRDAGMSTDHDR